jgi:hypothetical protein
VSTVPPTVRTVMPKDPARDYIPDALFENRPLSLTDIYGIEFPADLSHLRDFRTAWVLSLLLGMLGADRFYLGRPFTGALKLLTLGGLGFWWLRDVAAILTGHATDGGGHPLTGARKHRAAAGAITAVFTAALLAAAGTLAAPAATTAAAVIQNQVTDFVNPPPPPADHAWTVRARAAAGEPPAVLDLTSGSVYLTWHLPAPAVVYLQPATGPGIELFITRKASDGEKTFLIAPGTYTLVVAPESPGWTITAEEYVRPGD